MPSEPFIAEIYMGGMNFAPLGYEPCNGQVIPISGNTAVFALIGTTFGGNGQTTFALPDMRGRVPMGQGNGPGLSPRSMGESGGAETSTLTVGNLPPHSHSLNAVTKPGTTSDPKDAVLANTGALDREYSSEKPEVALNGSAIGSAGGGQPVSRLPPYLVVNFYIAMQGIFPPRS